MTDDANGDVVCRPGTTTEIHGYRVGYAVDGHRNDVEPSPTNARRTDPNDFVRYVSDR